MSFGDDVECSPVVTTVSAVSFVESNVPFCIESALTAFVAIFSLVIELLAISAVTIVPSTI